MKRLLLNILLCATLLVGCKDQVLGLDESEVLIVSTNNIEVDADANEVTVEVNSYLDYNVYCDAGWSWITPSAKSGSAGTKRITFAIAENLTISERSATITIGDSAATFSETISVLQAAGAPFIKTSVTEISADVERFTTKIDVDSNIDYTISSSEKWCHLGSTSGKAGKQILDIIVDENADTLARKATITLENKEHKITKTVSVSQGAFNPVVTVDTERLEFAAEGGEKYVEINANCDYKATTDADWLTVEQTSTVIKVTALSYVEVTERTADIALISGKYGPLTTIKVTQGAFVPELTVMPTTLDFTSDGGATSVVITANIDYEVTENADWLTVEQTATGIKVTALSYYEITDRTADITITNTKYSLSQTIKVTQAAFEPNGIIRYTSADGTIVNPYSTSAFDANIISNTYEDGCGVIAFDKEISSIGYHAFYRCSNLRSITIPNSVTKIGESAFEYCWGLTSITIPNSVTSIGEQAFWDCYGLTSITIPNSVTSIGEQAFWDCYGLTSVTIGNSVTSIGNGAFARCSKLEEFKGKFASSDGRCLIVKGVLNSFARSGLTTYTIPNSVTSIGDYAFYECRSLTSITIPNSVTSIGNCVFCWCDCLTSITIPNSVTSIGESAFSNCYGLTSITIPNSVTSIGGGAFYSCQRLISVYCKATTPPTLGRGGVFGKNGSNLIIYVPTASVSAYKSALEWSYYASSIVGYDF